MTTADPALMDLDRFWPLVDASRTDWDPRRRDGNMDAQRDRLRDLLTELPPREVGAFENRFTTLQFAAYHWDLWAAGYVLCGGCSDDGFTDFRYWLISMGREVYEAALADPESLAETAYGPQAEYPSFEEFGYVARRVLEDRGVTDAAAGLLDVPYPDEPAGEPWEEDDLPARFPKLTAAAERAEA